jgi:hypothetical protein
MIEKEPSVKEMVRLWKICVDFIESNEIGRREQIFTRPGVIEDAYGLINNICEEVGFYESDDSE